MFKYLFATLFLVFGVIFVIAGLSGGGGGFLFFGILLLIAFFGLARLLKRINPFYRLFHNEDEDDEN